MVLINYLPQNINYKKLIMQVKGVYPTKKPGDFPSCPCKARKYEP